MPFHAPEFVSPSSQSVSQLIDEKSDEMKEGMQMMYGVTRCLFCSERRVQDL